MKVKSMYDITALIKKLIRRIALNVHMYSKTSILTFEKEQILRNSLCLMTKRGERENI